jgi:putative phage-type endonuclease
MSEIEQRSEAWFALRLGKVTASRLADVLARTKTGYGASRDAYMAELLVERLTGARPDRFQSAAMRRGTDLEPLARRAYAFLTRRQVVETGFAHHPRIVESGASPDGLVADEGLVEFKCPEIHTHVETLLGAAVPARYIAQAQWQMACTNRVWCDWSSFCPEFPAGMDLFVKRVERDDGFIANAESEVVKFLGELAAKETALRKRYGLEAA